MAWAIFVQLGLGRVERIGTARTHGPPEGATTTSGSDGPMAMCRGSTRGIVSWMAKLKDGPGGGCSDDRNKGWFGSLVPGIKRTAGPASCRRPWCRGGGWWPWCCWDVARSCCFAILPFVVFELCLGLSAGLSRLFSYSCESAKVANTFK